MSFVKCPPPNELQGIKPEPAVYPNPAQDHIRIRLTDTDLQKGVVSVALYNMMGQQCAILYKGAYEVLVQEDKIALPALPAGVYMVRVTGDSGSTLLSQQLHIQP